jgi:hypothetical protein
MPCQAVPSKCQTCQKKESAEQRRGAAPASDDALRLALSLHDERGNQLILQS